MPVIEQRISGIEQRLERIETRLGMKDQAVTPKDDVQVNPSERDQAVPGAARPDLNQPVTAGASGPPSRKLAAKTSWTATNILGWGGVTALVMAAAYLIILAIDSGWLTPMRQVTFAVLGATALIGVGLALRHSDRQYASLLPACGVVILFLSVYGGHLYYHLINTTVATGSIIVVCALSLWLCRVFDSQLYALFAVAGSYSAPFLLPGLKKEITDLVIYYSAWSVLFCVYSVWVRSRRVYLLALYMALIGFDLIWRTTAGHNWSVAILFQFIQFVIFVSCAAYFSVRHDEPMTRDVAIAHAPALLIFYILEYSILDKHLPAYAPWIAVGSAALLGLAYLIARALLKTAPEGGRWLLSAYAALVLSHAGYLESVPHHWEPWVALLIVLLVAVYGLLGKDMTRIGWPMGLAIGLIFVGNYIRVVFQVDLRNVPANNLLVILYAVELYAGYYMVHRVESLKGLRLPLIYAGHIGAMAAAVHLFDEHLAVSLAWGVLALACVTLAIIRNDKTLGQSSLLVFAASAVKVFLYDLSGAAPLVRIFCLLVLGVTFYIGGWLYRKVNTLESAT